MAPLEGIIHHGTCEETAPAYGADSAPAEPKGEPQASCQHDACAGEEGVLPEPDGEQADQRIGVFKDPRVALEEQAVEPCNEAPEDVRVHQHADEHDRADERG